MPCISRASSPPMYPPTSDLAPPVFLFDALVGAFTHSCILFRPVLCCYCCLIAYGFLIALLRSPQVSGSCFVLLSCVFPPPSFCHFSFFMYLVCLTHMTYNDLTTCLALHGGLSLILAVGLDRLWCSALLGHVGACVRTSTT